jgi:hypothetical protein
MRCSQADRRPTAAATYRAVEHATGNRRIRETLDGRPRTSRESTSHIASAKAQQVCDSACAFRLHGRGECFVVRRTVSRAAGFER